MSASATPQARRPWAAAPGPALAAVLAYMALTVTVQLQAGAPYADWFKTADNAWRSAVLPLAAGALLLAAFVALTRWSHLWRDPIRLPASRWMRLAIGLWWCAVLLRLAGVRWAEVPLDLLAAVLAAGLLVGWAEELLFRGIVLRGLRAGGRPEHQAAWWTALGFGLFHLPNVAMGLGLAGLAQVPLAALSGVTLYATRRHTGRLWPAMVAHGCWDVSTFLAGQHGAAWSTLASLALQAALTGLGLVILVGLVRQDRATVAIPAPSAGDRGMG